MLILKIIQYLFVTECDCNFYIFNWLSLAILNEEYLAHEA